MKRERALQAVLVLVGLLYLSWTFPCSRACGSQIGFRSIRMPSRCS